MAKVENKTLQLSDPGQGLGMQLLKARDILLSEYRPVFREHNLTEQQWRILRFLVLQSPMDAASLSEKSVILAPSLTRIMRDLETRGLVVKSRNTIGPSRIHISITAEGKALVESMFPQIAERLQKVSSRLEPEERDQLKALLNKLIAGR